MASLSLTTVTANFDMNQNSNDGYEYYFVNPSASLTITLTSNVFEGLSYEIVRVDGVSLRIVTIDGNGQNINGNSTLTLSPNQRTKLVYMNGAWVSIKTTLSLL